MAAAEDLPVSLDELLDQLPLVVEEKAFKKRDKEEARMILTWLGKTKFMDRRDKIIVEYFVDYKLPCKK